MRSIKDQFFNLRGKPDSLESHPVESIPDATGDHRAFDEYLDYNVAIAFALKEMRTYDGAEVAICRAAHSGFITYDQAQKTLLACILDKRRNKL